VGEVLILGAEISRDASDLAGRGAGPRIVTHHALEQPELAGSEAEVDLAEAVRPGLVEGWGLECQHPGDRCRELSDRSEELVGEQPQQEDVSFVAVHPEQVLRGKSCARTGREGVGHRLPTRPAEPDAVQAAELDGAVASQPDVLSREAPVDDLEGLTARRIEGAVERVDHLGELRHEGHDDRDRQG